MTDLKTLQEEIVQIESLIKVVSDTDILDTPDVEDFYRNEDRIINGSHIDNAWEALALKGKIGELLQKSYTLGMMKGVEMVEGVMPEKEETNYPKYDGTDTPEDFRNTDCKLVQGWNMCHSEILSSITKLKQELK